MLGAKAGQSHNLRIHFGFFDDQGIARGNSFNLGVGKSGSIKVFNFSDMAIVGHDLTDELGLGLQNLPHIGIE